MKDVQTDLIFTALPTDYVTRLWPQIAKVLEKSVATADGKYTTDDVYSRIMDEELVAWVVLDPAKDDEIMYWFRIGQLCLLQVLRLLLI